MIRLAFGVPSAGKSLALQDIVNLELYDKRIGFAIVDRAGEWNETDIRTGAPNVRWRGNPPPLLIAPHDNTKAFEMLVEAREQRQGVLFQHPWEGLDVAELVRQVGDLVYCDDEIDLVALNGSQWKDNPLRDFVHRGRHLPDANGIPREVHIYGAARRVQNLHTDLTSMCDECLIFRIQGERTISRVVNEGMLPPECVDEARTQPNLHYYLWKSDGSINRGVLKSEAWMNRKY
jgi:hypothetical protein